MIINAMRIPYIYINYIYIIYIYIHKIYMYMTTLTFISEYYIIVFKCYRELI